MRNDRARKKTENEKAKEKGPEEGSQDFERRVTARWLRFNAERSSEEEREHEGERDQKWGSNILLSFEAERAVFVPTRCLPTIYLH